MALSESSIAFKSPILLIGGGEFDTALLLQLARRQYPVIAADGAANYLEGTGIIPEAIIGDMDSLANRTGWEQRTQVIEFAEQDTTDFEKCLYATTAPLYIALGFTGRQFDHTLAALHVLARYAEVKHVIMVDTVDLIYAATGPFAMDMSPGERLSVYPLGKVSFEASEGLKYKLDGLTMEQGGQIGTSNEVVNPRVAIYPAGPGQGPYALVFPHQHLGDLIDSIVAGETGG